LPPAPADWHERLCGGLIAIVTAVHANLPALETPLPALDAPGSGVIVHTGDAVGTGPDASAPLDRLHAVPDTPHLRRDDDAWLAHDVASRPPDWMDAGEVAHHRWVAGQAGEARRATVARWPPAIDAEIAGIHIRFTHYARPDGRGGFVPIIRDPSPADLDALF